MITVPALPYYTLDPLTPLVFRGGKPFGAGSRDGGRFPWPSSIAGALRTAWMRHTGGAASDSLALHCAGPLLARQHTQDAEHLEIYVPAPADALWLQPEAEAAALSVYRLLPGNFAIGSGADLPAGLTPVMLDPHAPKGKAQKLTSYWPLHTLLDWDAGRLPNAAAFKAQLLPTTHNDERTHVSIDPSTRAARDGKLFQTAGLDFSPADWRDAPAARWLLLARCSAELPSAALTLGGERGLAMLHTQAAETVSAPAEHLARIEHAERLALTLLTPAPFAHGLLPAWADGQSDLPGQPGLRLRVSAVANTRWDGVSGWDLARQQPRALRRAAPAGSTYWCDILTRPAEPGWAHKLWFASLADDPQDQRDGWAIVLPRTGHALDHHTL